MLRKSQNNFERYVKTIEAQVKKWFSYFKNVYYQRTKSFKNPTKLRYTYFLYKQPSC